MARERFHYDGVTGPIVVSNIDGIPDSGRTFFDAHQNPDAELDYITITEETFTIPPSGLIELDHYPAGNPLIDEIMVVTNNDDAAYIKQVGGTPDSGEVRVYPRRPYLDFSPADVGTTIKVTYRAGGSMPSGAALTEMSQSISMLKTTLGGSAVSPPTISGNLVIRNVRAAENIPADRFVSLSRYEGEWEMTLSFSGGDNVKVPDGYCVDTVSSGAVGDVLIIGVTDSLTTLGAPDGAQVLCSVATPGQYTWASDTESGRKLNGSEDIHYLGRHIGGGYALIDCVNTRMVTAF